MIALDDFWKLRLRTFLDSVTEIEDRTFMGERWVGEAAGLTEWLRPEGQPDRVGSLSVDLRGLEGAALGSILARLELPVRSGMSFEQVSSALGTEFHSLRFEGDGEAYQFAAGVLDGYTISCTFDAERGLVYLLVQPEPESSRRPG